MVSSDKISVCLVDDEQDVVDSFSEALGDEFEVMSFLSPALALAAFEAGYRPSIVVSDLQMPEMNGLKFIENMKSKGVESRVIVSTGYADKNAAVTALNLGVDGFLEKPFTVKQFKGMLHEVSQVSSAFKELVHDLCKLNELYFKRVALAENFIYEKGLGYPEDNESKVEFLSDLKNERQLVSAIDKRMKSLLNEGI